MKAKGGFKYVRRLALATLAVLLQMSDLHSLQAKPQEAPFVQGPPPYTFIPIKDGSTNAAYDGDTYSSSQPVDLQSGWTVNIPSSAVAVAAKITWRSSSVGAFGELRARSNGSAGVSCATAAANSYVNDAGIVPTHGGDVYLFIGGSGQVWIQIYGYYISQGSPPYTFMPIKDGSTNAAYDGDTYSSSQPVDLQSGWTVNIPSSAVAVAAKITWRSSSVGAFGELRARSNGLAGVSCATAVANSYVNDAGIVPTHDGDVYLFIGGSGQVWIQIYGYYISQGSPPYTFMPIKDGSTNAAYDGDTYNSSQPVDLQSGWTVNVPSSAVAVAAKITWRSSNVGAFGELRARSSGRAGVSCTTAVANSYVNDAGIVPTHGGDVYLFIGGSGQVWIQIYGYFVDWSSARTNTQHGVAMAYSHCVDMTTLNATWLRQWGTRPITCTGVESVPNISTASHLGALTADTNQGALSYGTDMFWDTLQNFTQWETAVGPTLFKIRVTNTDSTLTWAYLGTTGPCGPLPTCIRVYKDTARTQSGWNGAGINGKTPRSYIVCPSNGDGGGSLGGNSVYVMGFNEPNVETGYGGSDITPENAAPLWRTMERMYGTDHKLVSPGVGSSGTNGRPQGTDWLSQFHDEYYELYGEYPQLDVLDWHCYWNNVGDCQEALYTVMGYAASWGATDGVWVSEYAFWGPEYQDFNEDAILNGAQFTAWLTAEPEITRYAWFTNRAKQSDYQYWICRDQCHLCDWATGDPTDAGAMYASYGP